MNLSPEPWFAGLEERRRQRRSELGRAPERSRQESREQTEGQPEQAEGAGESTSDPARERSEPFRWGEQKKPAPKTAFAPGHPHHPRRAERRVAPSVALKRRQLLSQLLASGLAEEDIMSACLDEKHGLGWTSASQVKRALDGVKTEWARQDAEQAPRLKAMATRRLLGHISKAVSAKAWTAVGSLERTLADIQGTREPIRVEIDVTQAQRAALAGAIASMPVERVLELAELRRRLRAAENVPLLVEAAEVTTEKVVLEAFAEVESGQVG